MNKRYVAVGVFIALLGFLFAYASGQQALSNLSNPNNTATSTISMNGMSSAYIPVQFNTTSIFAVWYNSSNTINFFIANASAFQHLAQDLNSTNSLSNEAAALEGNGLLISIENRTGGIFPYQQQYEGYYPSPNYFASNTTLLQNGTYYIIFRNPNRYNTTILYSFYVRSMESESSSMSGSVGFGMASGIMMVGGLALAIYALFMKGAPKGLKGSEDEIQGIYSDIERKEKKRRRSAGRSGRRLARRPHAHIRGTGKKRSRGPKGQ